MITTINKFKYITQNNINISENLKYHLEKDISITENIFRPMTESFFDILKEVRIIYNENVEFLNENDKYLFENTEIGKFELYENQLVPLDLPMFDDDEYDNYDLNINEAEYKGKSVELNKPKRSTGPKKYKVYVKNPKNGKVKVIHFGDINGGLTAKVSDPKARKAFAARHQCHLKNDKTKAGYWACRINRYGYLWSGKTYPGFW